MLTNLQREAIVKEALSWKGTPYSGHSAVKGAAVDCGQFIYAVYRACGFLPEIALPRDYSLQLSKHRTSTEYVDLVLKFMRVLPQEDKALPGDVVIYKLGLNYSHAGIIVSWPHYVLQAEARHGVSGAHGIKAATFRHAPRLIVTLRHEYCGVV